MLVLETVFKAIHSLGATAWKDIPGYEQLADHLQNRKFIFELYETEDGALTLCILDQDYELQHIFGNWEGIGKGSVKDALKNLTEDETDYEMWDNDLFEYLQDQYNSLLLSLSEDQLECIDENEYTMEHLRELYHSGYYGDIVADNNGVYFEDLGYNGHIALDIPKYDGEMA